MSKTLTIKVEDSENPHATQELVITYDGAAPSEEQWDDILKFEDDHVGGRPNDR